jgi:hypothetical protein
MNRLRPLDRWGRGFESQVSSYEIVGGKGGIGLVFSCYFRFPSQFPFTEYAGASTVTLYSQSTKGLTVNVKKVKSLCLTN